MGLLKLFTRIQPNGGTPTAREFVLMQQRIEESISGLVQTVRTLQTATPVGACITAKMTKAQRLAWFDTTGLAHPGSPWEGWAIRNGNNGTDNTNGKFPRYNTDHSGDTGGSDSSAHTHAIDHDHGSFTSGTEAAHTHAVDHDHGSFTSGTEAAHTHGAGTYAADVNFDASTIYIRSGGSAFNANYKKAVTGTITGPGTYSYGAETLVAGTSGAGSTHSHSVDPPAFSGSSGAGSSHSHSVDPPAFTGTSGAASVTDNRPAFTEEVPLQRVA